MDLAPIARQSVRPWMERPR